MYLLALSFATEARGGDNMPSYLSKPHVTDSVLSHIFHSASVYAQEVGEYKADLYLKGRLQIHKQNRIIKYVPSMFRFEKGVNDYIHESISELHIRLLIYTTGRFVLFLQLLREVTAVFLI